MTLDSLLSGVTTVFTSVITTMGDNIITATLLGIGLVSAGAGLFAHFKAAAH